MLFCFLYFLHAWVRKGNHRFQSCRVMSMALCHENCFNIWFVTCFVLSWRVFLFLPFFILWALIALVHEEHRLHVATFVKNVKGACPGFTLKEIAAMDLIFFFQDAKTPTLDQKLHLLLWRFLSMWLYDPSTQSSPRMDVTNSLMKRPGTMGVTSPGWSLWCKLPSKQRHPYYLYMLFWGFLPILIRIICQPSSLCIKNKKYETNNHS